LLCIKLGKSQTLYHFRFVMSDANVELDFGNERERWSTVLLKDDDLLDSAAHLVKVRSGFPRDSRRFCSPHRMANSGT